MVEAVDDTDGLDMSVRDMGRTSWCSIVVARENKTHPQMKSTDRKKTHALNKAAVGNINAGTMRLVSSLVFVYGRGGRSKEMRQDLTATARTESTVAATKVAVTNSGT